MLTAAERKSAVITGGQRGWNEAPFADCSSLFGGKQAAIDNEPILRRAALFWRIQLFPRVFDHRDCRDLDISELAFDLLGAPDIDILDDIAGLGIDHDRPARALRVLPILEKGHCLVCSERALGRLDQIED